MGKFSDNTVNQRFNKVYRELEKMNLIKGKSDIAKKLGTYNHVINSILKGQRNITVEQLQLLFESYGVNANFLFGLSQDIFLQGALDAQGLPTRSLSDRQYGGRQNIALVPQRALAGYALEHQDSQFLDNFQHFSVPGLESSDLIAFEISGDSMLPTITNGDIVICEPLERPMNGSFPALRANQVYVVVTENVVAKRIQPIREGNKVSRLRLISDNDSVYKPYEVDLPDVKQILTVKCRLTNHAIS